MTSPQQVYMKAELKVLTAFVYFTFIMVLGITINTVVLRNYKEFEEELTVYFTCESMGVSPGKTCSRSGFENADYTSFTVTINVMVLTLYPFVTLIYIVNIAEIKRVLLKRVKARESSNSKATLRSATSKRSDKDPPKSMTTLTLVDTQTNGYLGSSLEAGDNGTASAEGQRSC